MLCDVCGRRFRGESDKAHHKCTIERRRPVCKQGAVQSEACRWWFHSRGELVVHRWRREELVEDDAAGGAGVGVSQEQLEHRVCGRAFSRQET